jgi:photosystem II stability/assembly factor-like uncharacterized protein
MRGRVTALAGLMMAAALFGLGLLANDRSAQAHSLAPRSPQASLGWIVVNSPTTEHLGLSDFVSPTDGWIVGTNGTILHWDGVNWQTVSNPASVRLNSVAMVSANDGWITGELGVILHWDGVAWTTFASPTAYTVDGVDGCRQ